MIALFVGFCALVFGLWWGRRATPVAEKLVVRNTEDHSLLKNAHVQRLALLGSQAAGAAHEMKGALSVLYCLVEELESDNVHAEVVDALRESTQMLHVLSDDMTGFARSSTIASAASLARCVENAVRMTKTERRGVAQVETWVDGLPRVAMDEGRLVQVLVNLFRNSADALREQGGGRIRVSAQIEESRVLVVVEDDGPGIEAAVASEIFKPFVTTKGRGEGAGLGLAVSSSIAREVGGELSLAPGVLGGACFALRLPVFEEEREERLAFAS